MPVTTRSLNRMQSQCPYLSQDVFGQDHGSTNRTMTSAHYNTFVPSNSETSRYLPAPYYEVGRTDISNSRNAPQVYSYNSISARSNSSRYPIYSNQPSNIESVDNMPLAQPDQPFSSVSAVNNSAYLTSINSHESFNSVNELELHTSGDSDQWNSDDLNLSEHQLTDLSWEETQRNAENSTTSTRESTYHPRSHSNSPSPNIATSESDSNISSSRPATVRMRPTARTRITATRPAENESPIEEDVELLSTLGMAEVENIFDNENSGLDQINYSSRRTTRQSSEHLKQQNHCKPKKREGSSVKLKADSKKTPLKMEFSKIENPNCSICIDEILPYDIASINGCSHQFCFQCIEKWSERENTCPLCKKRFTKIDRINKPPKKRKRGDGVRAKNTKRVKNRNQRADMTSGTAIQSLLASIDHGNMPQEITRLLYNGISNMNASNNDLADLAPSVGTRPQSWGRSLQPSRFRPGNINVSLNSNAFVPPGARRSWSDYNRFQDEDVDHIPDFTTILSRIATNRNETSSRYNLPSPFDAVSLQRGGHEMNVNNHSQNTYERQRSGNGFSGQNHMQQGFAEIQPFFRPGASSQWHMIGGETAETALEIEDSDDELSNVEEVEVVNDEVEIIAD